MYTNGMNPKVDNYIKNQEAWKGELLTRLRSSIHNADPEIVEEWKWDVPVFVHGKMVCAISSFKEHVKINFFSGAKLSDPHKLFNNGFDSKQHRSIDFKEGDTIKEQELKELIKEAVSLR
jgi:hypothetical protein